MNILHDSWWIHFQYWCLFWQQKIHNHLNFKVWITLCHKNTPERLQDALCNLVKPEGHSESDNASKYEQFNWANCSLGLKGWLRGKHSPYKMSRLDSIHDTTTNTHFGASQTECCTAMNPSEESQAGCPVLSHLLVDITDPTVSFHEKKLLCTSTLDQFQILALPCSSLWKVLNNISPGLLQGIRDWRGETTPKHNF